LGAANAVFNLDSLEEKIMSDETIEQTFTVPAGKPARLEVSNISGSVEVLPGEEGVIAVNAVKHSQTGDLERTEVQVSQAEDGSVKAEVKYREGWRILAFTKPCQVSFTVRVPRSCEVKAAGVSCSLKVHELEGNFDVSSVSGQITINELSGAVKLNTVSGDVDGGDIHGSLQFNTVSGSVRLKESQLSSVTGNTVSGNITLQTPLAGGPYAVHTVSGDVRMTVPVDTHCTAEVKGISGRVHTAFPQTAFHRQNGRHVAEVQGGGVPVKLNGVSGSLWLGPAEGETPAPAHENPQPAQAARPNRKEVLDRIERGEITVEEGLELLS
jgi:DUF4097 and DUF4098 domain-containing protein YvlB